MKSVWISIIAIMFLIVIGIEVSILNEVIKQKDFPQTDEEINIAIAEIDKIVKKNKVNGNVKIIDEYLTSSTLGKNTEDYFENFEVDVISVTIEVGSFSLVIIPTTDFLDTQEYQFNDSGELVKYICTSNTKGGSMEYYFYNNKILLTISDLLDKDDVQFTNEDVEDILNRAEKLYGMFL